MSKKQLACPKCKGTKFELYLNKIENFFPPELGSTDLQVQIEKCAKCGWESNTTDPKEAKRRIQVMLRKGIPDWEGFIEVNSCNKTEKENK